jgi:hypothetical protein
VLAERQPVHPTGVRTADHPNLGHATDVGVVHAAPDRAAESDHRSLADRRQPHRQLGTDQVAGHPQSGCGARQAAA